MKVFPIVKIESNSEFVLIHRLVSSLPKMSDESEREIQTGIVECETNRRRSGRCNKRFIHLYSPYTGRKKENKITHNKLN